MYDETVKRLKNCATQAAPCLTCDMTDDGSCIETLMKQAADAIEELSRFKEECDACGSKTQSVIESLQKKIPRWIPVEERLPEDRRDVQITVFWHDAWRTMYGYFDGAFWHLYAPMHTEVADVEVIGWMEKPKPMPLPELPKEET